MKWKAVSRTVLTLALTTMLTLNCQQLFTTSKATVGITSVPDFSKNNTVILEAATAPQWLDPHVSYFDYDYWILQQTLETLLWYNGSSSTQVIPWLAESYTKINDTCYQFTLRQNIKFQDGTLFDATAVWFSLNRLLIMDGTSDTGNHGSQAAWIVEQMLDTNLFWAFTGSQPYDSAWVKNVLDQNFVQVMNASIVRINVKTPAQLQFPYLLSAPWAAIISPTEVITKEYAFHGWGSPIEGLFNMTKYFVRTAGMGHTYFNTPTSGWTMGTGPYYPYSYNPTTYKAILKVNTNYWGGPTNIQYPIGTPKINEIDYDIDGNGKIEIKDFSTAAKNYGKIDP